MELTFGKMSSEDFQYVYNTRKELFTPHLERIGRKWEEPHETEYAKSSFNPETLRSILLNGVRIGFCNIRFHEGAERFGNFCIETKFQNKGIGTKIMQMLAREFDKKNRASILNVLKGSPASHLYKRFGYLPYGSDEISVWYMRPRLNAKSTEDGWVD